MAIQHQELTSISADEPSPQGATTASQATAPLLDEEWPFTELEEGTESTVSRPTNTHDMEEKIKHGRSGGLGIAPSRGKGTERALREDELLPSWKVGAREEEHHEGREEEDEDKDGDLLPQSLTLTPSIPEKSLAKGALPAGLKQKMKQFRLSRKTRTLGMGSAPSREHESRGCTGFGAALSSGSAHEFKGKGAHTTGCASVPLTSSRARKVFQSSLDKEGMSMDMKERMEDAHLTSENRENDRGVVKFGSAPSREHDTTHSTGFGAASSGRLGTPAGPPYRKPFSFGERRGMVSSREDCNVRASGFGRAQWSHIDREFERKERERELAAKAIPDELDELRREAINFQPFKGVAESRELPIYERPGVERSTDREEYARWAAEEEKEKAELRRRDVEARVSSRYASSFIQRRTPMVSITEGKGDGDEAGFGRQTQMDAPARESPENDSRYSIGKEHLGDHNDGFRSRSTIGTTSAEKMPTSGGQEASHWDDHAMDDDDEDIESRLEGLVLRTRVKVPEAMIQAMERGEEWRGFA